MRHQFIVECETDKNFQDANGARMLRDHVSGRLWEMDGVVHGTAVARIVPKECMIVSRIEYEALQAKVQHMEDAYTNMRDFAQSQGLDTTTRQA